MTSFDENRTKQTVRALVDLIGRCEQVIVVSHNVHFLRDIFSATQKTGLEPVARKDPLRRQQLRGLRGLRLVQMCSQPYYERFLSAVQYLNGTYCGDPRQIAEKLRVLVEEYYKRRYPNDIAATGRSAGSSRRCISDWPTPTVSTRTTS